jgi:hypothetical protein
MLWIGDRLSAVERACMRSVTRQGHRLVLYTYDPVEGVPEGVECADASTILPRETIVRHSSGSVALFSDRFRFELMRRGLGLWLDADAYLVAPLTIDPDRHFFAYCEPGAIGSGVLYLPQSSPIIAPVLALFEAPYIPDWMLKRDWLRAHWRRLRAGKIVLGDLPWGVAGPMAINALARRNGLIEQVLPSEVLYPWHWRQADWIFDPERSLDAFVRPETRALHMYNYVIASRKDLPAPQGSFMHRLQQEGA